MIVFFDLCLALAIINGDQIAFLFLVFLYLTPWAMLLSLKAANNSNNGQSSFESPCRISTSSWVTGTFFRTLMLSWMTGSPSYISLSYWVSNSISYNWMTSWAIGSLHVNHCPLMSLVHFLIIHCPLGSLVHSLISECPLGTLVQSFEI